MNGYGAMFLRVTVGAIYLHQFYLALFRSTPQDVARYLARTAGLPAPTVVALAALVVLGAGGLLLVIGLWTRLAAGANATVLLGTMAAVGLRQGALLRGPLADAVVGRVPAAGLEYVALLAAATIAVALIGPGVWSVGK